jgi:predicted MFS family arabinose efflux permease
LTQDARASRWLFALLAFAAGATVANLYYNQPLLAALAASFGVSEGAVGAIPMLTQLGYGLGMLGLVPLGDRLERRGLIVATTAASGLVLLGVAAAPSLAWLSGLSLLLGLASMVPQAIVPYAAAAARPEERGAAVGTVVSGLLVGILLSRTASGLLGARFGWRAVYVMAAVLMLALSIALRALLPAQRPEREVPWGELYRSLGALVRREPVLRRHSVLGALTFGAFSVFWSTLSFHLEALPEHYGSAVAGAFGVVGVAGALAAPLVGRFADRRDPRLVNGAAIAVLTASFAVLAAAGRSLVGIAVGVVLLDLGAQANHISNQARVFALDPALRSRLNTVYMVSYFAGGAAGSWLGAVVFGRFGWAGVCGAGAVLGATALLFFAVRVAPRGGEK